MIAFAVNFIIITNDSVLTSLSYDIIPTVNFKPIHCVDASASSLWYYPAVNFEIICYDGSLSSLYFSLKCYVVDLTMPYIIIC